MRTTILRYVMPAAVMGLVPTADAIVVELSAECRSLVKSFVSGAEDSSDESIEIFGPESGLKLPISTRAILETLAEEDDPQARGLAFADFDDPTRQTPGRNPEELAVEADCFSNHDSTAYELSSTVVEERVVRLSAEELGNPIDGTRNVRSSFFPSGAMFLWSSDAERDLTGLSVELSFKTEPSPPRPPPTWRPRPAIFLLLRLTSPACPWAT